VRVQIVRPDHLALVALAVVRFEWEEAIAFALTRQSLQQFFHYDMIVTFRSRSGARFNVQTMSLISVYK
jgi:hypothetical protein